jgi:hypothetical protein
MLTVCEKINSKMAKNINSNKNINKKLKNFLIKVMINKIIKINHYLILILMEKC